jgi:hypothetical protein
MVSQVCTVLTKLITFEAFEGMVYLSLSEVMHTREANLSKRGADWNSNHFNAIEPKQSLHKDD